MTHVNQKTSALVLSWVNEALPIYILPIYTYNFLLPAMVLWDTWLEREGSSFLFLYTFQLKKTLEVFWSIIDFYWRI